MNVLMNAEKTADLCSFEDFFLSPDLVEMVKGLGYTAPTQIQSEMIPLVMARKDVLGASHTGTGKTAAFMIPLVSLLLDESLDTALIMAPTRELASQIALFARKLLKNKRSVFVALLIGGENIVKQFIQLERRPTPRLIVGTPGRIYDHIKRGKLSLKKADFLVLDETDRMLDIGFEEQIKAIIDCMPTSSRQTLMLSATLPPNIMSLSAQYMRNPSVVRVGNDSIPAANIKQEVLNVASYGTKYDALLNELEKRTGSVIIFVKTRADAADIADRLLDCSHSASCIHGDMKQVKRDRVIRDFRDKRYRIMVATDVASRGLDIPHIEHVINYDLPQCADDYIHRIGRTARAGATGSAVVFVTPGDKSRWLQISRSISGNKPEGGDARQDNNPHRRREQRNYNSDYNKGGKRTPSSRFSSRDNSSSFRGRRNKVTAEA